MNYKHMRKIKRFYKNFKRIVKDSLEYCTLVLSAFILAFILSVLALFLLETILTF